MVEYPGALVSYRRSLTFLRLEFLRGLQCVRCQVGGGGGRGRFARLLVTQSIRWEENLSKPLNIRNTHELSDLLGLSYVDMLI